MKFIWKPITENKYNFTIKKKQFQIDTYELDHRVTSFGYGISMLRRKLKEQYLNLDSKKIIELKKLTDIFEMKKYGCILFISDTGKKPLKYLPFNNYQIVIIECFEEEHYKKRLKESIYIGKI